MKSDQEKMLLLKKVSTGQIDPAEIEENQLLKRMVFKQKLINYTLDFNHRNGRYYVSQLDLTENGKGELTTLLHNKRTGKKNKVTIMSLFVMGIFIGILIANFLL